MNQTPHIVILPSPGMGHLIPVIEFAKQLVHHHEFSATIIITTTTSVGAPLEAQKTILESLPKSINHFFLPPVNFKERFEGNEAATQVALTVSHSLASFRDVFKSLIAATNLVALVVDPASTDAIDVAKEFEILSYLFFPSNAMALSWTMYMPKLDEMVSCEYRDLTEPVQIPGCNPVHGRDFMDLAQDRKSEAYKWFLHHAKRISLAEGIIVNSFVDLEPGPMKALQGEELTKLPVYPIGPIVPAGSSSGLERDKCLAWLDNQSRGSVLFVSFGSGGTLSCEQLNELALGLEISGQRFLWVLKSPNDGSANATYFGFQNQDDPLAFLPKGFLEMTKGRGLVVPNWAPQADILSHGSIGGFVTHCGWNSILESVVNGVPLIAWPLYAEQKMNAILVAKNLKVAIRPSDQNVLVDREDIAKIVRALMEGDEGKMIRNRMVELKEAALKALSKDGSSTKSLSELARTWKKC